MEQQNQQPIQENTEPKSATKTNWKLIGITVVLALVLGGVLISWQMQPAAPMQQTPPPPVSTPSPQPQAINNQQSTIDMSDWQTYRNDEFGFEFQYPKEFAESQDCKARMSKVQKNVVDIGNRTDVSVVGSKGLNLEDFVAADFILESLFDIHRSEQIVGEEKAITISYRVEGTGRFGTVTYVKHADKIYRFDYLAGVDCSVAYATDMSELDVLNQILSTFRFVEEAR
ncbi:MAG: hypothetical protein AAB567_03070 [Patescibacteria group bacterium]